MKKLNLILSALSIALLVSDSNCFAQSTEANAIVYQCPMKCEGEKTYDKPGKCPICGMNLAKVETKSNSEPGLTKVTISGAMMNVMRKGELFGTINLDTISNREHLYGLGPIEYLKGEILIADGKSYITKVAANRSIAIEETYKVKAPFFVSENVGKWNEIPLPDSIQSIPQLESFLDKSTKNHSRPFAFRVTAIINNCEIHIVNLPTGTKVHSPEEAQKNRESYALQNESAELIGFFSTKHQGIFTHHDRFVHIHLITTDRKKMGHLENMTIKKGTAKLYLPFE